ncbi:DUF1214 domain-containing protein [Phenylobacterium sp.]|uniref:DUF1214 domain-containing protein n=1 Tax=Phenylobacterium sp. TaxID=1871053 RepID=UPI00261BFE17|nr:DUF1214 domain-containing protein [Phenylobacterium sp.]
MSRDEPGAVLQAAWDAMCDELKVAGAAVMREGVDQTEASLARGFEHLAHLVLDSLTWATAPGPDFPRFVHMNDTPEIADNRFAATRPDASYRITGRIDTLCDVNISLHEGWPFLGGRRVWGDLGRRDLHVDEAGRFEIVVSAEPQAANWLPLPPEARIVQVREYFTDWDSHRPGVLEIVRQGSEGQAPPRPQAADVAARFASVGPWLQGYLTTHGQMVRHRFSVINGVAQPAPAAACNRNVWYGPGRFRLTPDEALIIEFQPPKARAWTIQWLTFPWYEPPDLANRATSLMAEDAVVGSDGRVRVVVTGRDPGVPNWLDIGDSTEGVVMLRWIWCDEAFPVTSTMTEWKTLHERLPADTARVTPDTRKAQQARRRSHWAGRAR